MAGLPLLLLSALLAAAGSGVARAADPADCPSEGDYLRANNGSYFLAAYNASRTIPEYAEVAAAASQTYGNWTCFVPTDAAIAAVATELGVEPEALLEPPTLDTTAEIIFYHCVRDGSCGLGDDTDCPVLAESGEEVEGACNDAKVVGGPPYVDCDSAEDEDVSGKIYMIDSVLVPPSLCQVSPWQEIADRFSSRVDAITEQAQEAAEAVSNRTQEALDGLRDRAEEAVNRTQEIGEQAGERLNEVGEAVVNRTQEIGNNAVDAVQPVVDAAVNLANEVVDTVTGRLGGDDDDDDGGKRKLLQVSAITAPLGPGGIQSPFSMIWESLTNSLS